MFHAIAAGFNYLWGFLKDLGTYFLNAIAWLLKPVFDLIGAVFYFVYKIGVVLLKVVEVVLSIGKLLIGIGSGLFKTITGLSYTGTPAVIPDSYNQVFTKLQPVFMTLQLDKVAYLIIFTIWIYTAFTAIKIIGDMRGGASSD